MGRIGWIGLLLIGLLLAGPYPRMACAQDGPTPTPPEETFPEEEAQFASGSDTLYGSLMRPASVKSADGKHPAALIIAGSGPTDRNGNNPLIPGEVGTYRYFASALAKAGVITLRYDKLGTGRTGLASRADDLASVDFQLFVDHARAAYDYLATRPDVDPARVMIVGHSEGGLIALVMAAGWASGTPPAALALAAPPGRPYLEMLREQFAAQLAEGARLGLIQQQQADETLAELDSIIQSLQTTGSVPAEIKTQAFRQIFSPANLNFLRQIAAYDPVRLAARLPAGLPVLLLCGERDTQAPCQDVRLIDAALRAVGSAKVEFAALPNVNHVFKEVTGASRGVLDYGDPQFPFARAAGERLADFARRALAAP